MLVAVGWSMLMLGGFGIESNSTVLRSMDVNQRLPGVHGRPGTLNKLIFRTMSQAVLAEAVFRNILYYIHHTKHIRQGSAIACSYFLMYVCFTSNRVE